MNIDLSKIPPQTLQMLGQQFGVSSPEELMQLIQSNPQIAQQLLGNSVSTDKGDDAWIEQAANKQANTTGRMPPDDVLQSDTPIPRADPRKPRARSQFEEYYDVPPPSGDLPVQSAPNRRSGGDTDARAAARWYRDEADAVMPDEPNMPSSFNDRFVGQPVDRNYRMMQHILENNPQLGYDEGDTLPPTDNTNIRSY